MIPWYVLYKVESFFTIAYEDKVGNPLNGDDYTGQRANTEPWRRAMRREELGRSSWETRGEGTFEARRKGLGGEDRGQATEATKERGAHNRCSY